MKLKRVKQGEGVSVYTTPEGAVYLLRKVDREYKNTPKKPAYYLSVKRKGETKAKYLSGLFPAGENTFSLDIKDGLGVKEMHTLKMEAGGASAELVKGKARELALTL